MANDFYSLTPEKQSEFMQGLAAEALKQWNLEGSELTLISMRENAVYRVGGSNGEQYAMRVHRHGYHSDAALRSEHQWSTALAEAGLDLPPIIPTAAGESFCLVQSPGVPEPRQVACRCRHLSAHCHGEGPCFRQTLVRPDGWCTHISHCSRSKRHEGCFCLPCQARVSRPACV